MKTQIFIEGRNGGRPSKASIDDTWRCLDYEGPPPPVTIATEHGAIEVTVSDDGNSVTIESKVWGLDDDAPKVGSYRTLYDGPIA